MLFSCSSDSISESKESIDQSSVNTTLNEEVEKARANFEEHYRMYMFDKEGMTEDLFVQMLYQYAYDYLKSLDITIPVDKAEAVALAFANFYDVKSVSSPGKMGIARSIEIINNTKYDLNIDALIVDLVNTSTTNDYLHVAQNSVISPNRSFALQQITNQFDFPFCSTTHSVGWHNYNYPLAPVSNVACGNVYSLSNVAALSNFLYLKLFKYDFYIANTQTHTGIAGGYDPLGRNVNRHLIGFGEINHEPIGVVSHNGVQIVVSEIALIVGGSDIHVIQLSVQ